MKRLWAILLLSAPLLAQNTQISPGPIVAPPALLPSAAGSTKIGSSTLPFGDLTLTQTSNGDSMIYGQRNTDTSPTGYFLQLQTQGGQNLFTLDPNGNVSGGTGTFSGAVTSLSYTAGTPGTISGQISIPPGSSSLPTPVPNDYNITASTSQSGTIQEIKPATAASGLFRTGNSSGVLTDSIAEISGDCTTSGSNAITCTKTSGTAFGTFATQNYATPPAIGGTTPAAGAFTTLSASSTVSGSGFSTYLASPPAIGGTAAAAGSFTTLSASSTVSGSGFSTYLASPPAIGGTAPAAGTFNSLTDTAMTGGPFCVQQTSGVLSSTGSACGSGGGGTSGSGVFSSSGNITTALAGTTYYAPVNGLYSSLLTSTSTLQSPAAAASSAISNLSVSLSAATASGQTLTVTLLDNATAESVTCTVASASSSCSDTTHSYTLAAGHDVAWSYLVTGGTSYTGVLGIGAQVGVAAVTSFSGDGTLITNSASTGAVTATLGNAGAHKFWGNNTASSAAPGYDLIGTSDVTPNEYVAGGGTANAQTATLSPAATALTAGLKVRWLPTAANTSTTPTLAVNGLTATTIVKAKAAALDYGDLATNVIADATYDGTYFELQNPATGTGNHMVYQLNTQSGVTFSTTAASYTTVFSYSVPAGQLAPTGNCLRAEVTWHFTSGGVGTSWQWSFGGTVGTTEADGQTTAYADARVLLCETGTNTQQMTNLYYAHNATLTNPGAPVTPSITTTSSQTFLIQGACTSTCSTAPVISPDTFTVEWLRP